MSTISIQISDKHWSRAKNKLLFLNTVHKVKAQRSGELFVKNVLIFSITLQCWTWKQISKDEN